jgi:N-methylhydantoinase A
MFGTAGERGGFRPDRALAEAAIEQHIARPLGMSLTDAALGIVEVANAKMAAALENEIIGRGFDPREFMLMSYGGAGPFHAAGYAASLGIETIVVPGEAASVWSAFGISQADIRYQLEQSVVRLGPFDAADLEAQFATLHERAIAMFGERENLAALRFRRFARMRFQWQLHELEVRLPAEPLTAPLVDAVTRGFVAMYQERYGEAALLPGARLELASLRLEAAIPMGSARLERLMVGAASSEQGSRPVYFERGAGAVDTPTFRGDALVPGQVISGPAVIDLATTGIVVPASATCERRATGDFVLRLSPS